MWVELVFVGFWSVWGWIQAILREGGERWGSAVGTMFNKKVFEELGKLANCPQPFHFLLFFILCICTPV